MPPSEWPACQLDAAQPPAPLQAAEPRQHVLVVVDMQKDYDTAANKELYGEVRSPYANPIAALVEPINRLIRSRHWARVAYTYDSLPPAMGRTFCLAGSAGAALLDRLDVRPCDLHFKKASDDSFCDATGEPEATTQCSRLVAVLAAHGHTPRDTTLHFAGQRFERCMLKTVMHARALGFECAVHLDASFVQQQEPDPEWALPPAVALAARAARAHAGSPPGVPEWAAEVHAAAKSAGARLATGYMQAAGVRLSEGETE